MKTSVFDAANYIETPEDVVAYLNVVLEESGPALVDQADVCPRVADVA